jgi:hypothetical protein
VRGSLTRRREREASPASSAEHAGAGQAGVGASFLWSRGRDREGPGGASTGTRRRVIASGRSSCDLLLDFGPWAAGPGVCTDGRPVPLGWASRDADLGPGGVPRETRLSTSDRAGPRRRRGHDPAFGASLGPARGSRGRARTTSTIRSWLPPALTGLRIAGEPRGMAAGRRPRRGRPGPVTVPRGPVGVWADPCTGGWRTALPVRRRLRPRADGSSAEERSPGPRPLVVRAVSWSPVHALVDVRRAGTRRGAGCGSGTGYGGGGAARVLRRVRDGGGGKRHSSGRDACPRRGDSQDAAGSGPSPRGQAQTVRSWRALRPGPCRSPRPSRAGDGRGWRLVNAPHAPPAPRHRRPPAPRSFHVKRRVPAQLGKEFPGAGGMASSRTVGAAVTARPEAATALPPADRPSSERTQATCRRGRPQRRQGPGGPQGASVQRPECSPRAMRPLA